MGEEGYDVRWQNVEKDKLIESTLHFNSNYTLALYNMHEKRIRTQNKSPTIPINYHVARRL